MRALLVCIFLLLAGGSAWAQFEGSQPAQAPDENPAGAPPPPPPPPPHRAPGVGEPKIYKFVLPGGRVSYSDKPPEDAEEAEEVTLSPLQTFSPPPTPSLAAEAPPQQGDPKYEELAVTSPANGEALRDNGGNVSVSISLKPGLHSGHSIDLIMDGKSIGSGNSTSVTLSNVDRGAHTVQARVLDEAGKVLLSSKGVTFYLKRAGVRP